MGQTDNSSPLSMAHVSMTAFVVLIAATFFGLRSGGTDGDKSGEKQAGERVGYAATPPASAGNEEPHRAFIFNYLRGTPAKPAATPLVMARCPFTKTEAK